MGGRGRRRKSCFRRLGAPEASFRGQPEGGRSAFANRPAQMAWVIPRATLALSPSQVFAQRLAKWPGRSPADAVADRVTRLIRFLPPHLRLMCLKVALNPIPTKARMGERADCMLGRGASGDSLGHCAVQGFP